MGLARPHSVGKCSARARVNALGDASPPCLRAARCANVSALTRVSERREEPVRSTCQKRGGDLLIPRRLFPRTCSRLPPQLSRFSGGRGIGSKPPHRAEALYTLDVARAFLTAAARK